MIARQFVDVDLAARSYPIVIGPGLLADESLFAAHLPHRQIFLISNEVVAPLYLEAVSNQLTDRQLLIEILPDGESEKNLANFTRLQDLMIAAQFHRDCLVVALGGGVVGDLAGFVAACYQRGVDFVQVPTTLLAQVDSSVGGKTAVNHPRAKNIVGAFHQPRAVLADICVLDTLPARELRAGLAEVIKYGAALDAGFFDWLEENIDALLDRRPEPLIHAIKRCCELKARVVAMDERESGQRALLNFGHTFGHAVEALEGYGEWLHGEGVAAGMAAAAELSTTVCGLEARQRDRLVRLIERAGLPTRLPARTPQSLLDAMAMDKKVASGQLRFVLLSALGSARVVGDVSEEKVAAAISESQDG